MANVVWPGILGYKIGMTQVYDDQGQSVTVSVVQAGPMYVTQIKTVENDGYNAIQVGFGDQSDKRLTFPKYGHLKKSGVGKNLRHLKEIRVEDPSQFTLGQEITTDILTAGMACEVTGTSKGKGFAGGVKRYHFKGQHMTHGFMTHRRPLSNGATGPQRVFKGSRRPGRMGGETVTQKGLNVFSIDNERGIILVDGSIPGANGELVIVKALVRKGAK